MQDETLQPFSSSAPVATQPSQDGSKPDDTAQAIRYAADTLAQAIAYLGDCIALQHQEPQPEPDDRPQTL